MPMYRFSVQVSGSQVFEFEAPNAEYAERIVADLNLISKGEDPIDPASDHLEPELVDETVEDEEGTYLFLGE